METNVFVGPPPIVRMPSGVKLSPSIERVGRRLRRLCVFREGRVTFSSTGAGYVAVAHWFTSRGADGAGFVYSAVELHSGAAPSCEAAACLLEWMLDDKLAGGRK